MPLARHRPRRGGWAAFTVALLAACVCLLAASPLDHHDLACHLKSTTHCTACLSASVPGTEARLDTAGSPLAFTDLLQIDRESCGRYEAAAKPGDRSPPAA